MHRAGVREGNVIIKVNGQQVTESSHGEVGKLKQTGNLVGLTVVHFSRFTNMPAGVWGGSVRDLREELEQGSHVAPVLLIMMQRISSTVIRFTLFN